LYEIDSRGGEESEEAFYDYASVDGILIEMMLHGNVTNYGNAKISRPMAFSDVAKRL
jgi:hypothetical protein